MSYLIDFACKNSYFDFVDNILINFEFYKLFNKNIKTSIDWNKKIMIFLEAVCLLFRK